MSKEIARLKAELLREWDRDKFISLLRELPAPLSFDVPEIRDVVTAWIDQLKEDHLREYKEAVKECGSLAEIKLEIERAKKQLEASRAFDRECYLPPHVPCVEGSIYDHSLYEKAYTRKKARTNNADIFRELLPVIKLSCFKGKECTDECKDECADRSKAVSMPISQVVEGIALKSAWLELINAEAKPSEVLKNVPDCSLTNRVKAFIFIAKSRKGYINLEGESPTAYLEKKGDRSLVNAYSEINQGKGKTLKKPIREDEIEKALPHLKEFPEALAFAKNWKHESQKRESASHIK